MLEMLGSHKHAESEIQAYFPIVGAQLDVACSRKKEVVPSSMHLITMNRQTIISGHHVWYV